MKNDKIFIRTTNGQVLEIGNWKARRSKSDAFVGIPLSDTRLAVLEAGHTAGKSDQQIYKEMHPAGDEIAYGLPLDALHISQLSQIASQLLEQDVPSLQRLRKDDLIILIQKLVRLKEVRIGIKVQVHP